MGHQKIDRFFPQIMGILRLKLCLVTGLLRTITIDYALRGIMGKNLQNSILSVVFSISFTLNLILIVSGPIGNKGLLSKGSPTT